MVKAREEREQNFHFFLGSEFDYRENLVLVKSHPLSSILHLTSITVSKAHCGGIPSKDAAKMVNLMAVLFPRRQRK